MKKYLFTLVILFGLLNFTYSQDYRTAVGLRLGYPGAISYKTFVSESSAFEGYAGFRGYDGFSNVLVVGLLYQKHNDINLDGVSGLKWYYGAGGNISLTSGGSGIGISGVLGLDYSFDDIPLNLSLDWIPTVILAGRSYSGFTPSFGAFTARYILTR